MLGVCCVIFMCGLRMVGEMCLVGGIGVFLSLVGIADPLEEPRGVELRAPYGAFCSVSVCLGEAVIWWKELVGHRILGSSR